MEKSKTQNSTSTMFREHKKIILKHIPDNIEILKKNNVKFDVIVQTIFRD